MEEVERFHLLEFQERSYEQVNSMYPRQPWNNTLTGYTWGAE